MGVWGAVVGWWFKSSGVRVLLLLWGDGSASSGFGWLLVQVFEFSGWVLLSVCFRVWGAATACSSVRVWGIVAGASLLGLR